MRFPTLPLIAVVLPVVLPAQSRPVLPPSEFHRVELVMAPTVSSRASWIAYPVRRPVAVADSVQALHLHRRQPDTTLVFPRAQGARFSVDERWAVWLVAPSDAERERAATARRPARTRAVVMALATLTRDSVDNVAETRFDATGRFLLLEHHPARDSADHRTVTVIDLQSGRRTTLGHVAEWRWSGRGSFLALTLGVRDGAPGGLQLFDARAHTLTALGTPGHAYRQTRWRRNALDLVTLRARDLTAAAGTPHRVELWRAVDRAPAAPASLGDGLPGIADSLMLVAHEAPLWSEDGTRLRLSVQPRPAPVDSSVARAPRDTLPGVQIWHPADVRIFPAQQQQAAAAARRGIPLVWDPGAGQVRLVDARPTETVEFSPDLAYAFVTSDSAYPWGAMFGRRYLDGHLVEVSAAQRRPVLDSVRYAWLSPGGRHLLTFDGRDYHTLDVRSGRRANITAGLGADFAIADYDTPTDLLPPVGRGGWLDDDAGVLLYDRYDVWLVRPDGSGGRRLTRGAEDSVVHRIVTLDTSRVTIDPRRPLLYAVHGEWSGKRGYARAAIGATPERLRFEDKSYWFLTRADSADALVWREESRQQPPVLFASDGRFRDVHRISDANGFLDQYAAGRTELVRFTNETGRPLQGILLFPADHDPARRYPMIVYAYELLSPTLHYYQAPSERSYYNFTRWTQEGYFVLLPDVHFRHRDPGVSLLETLRPAVGSIVARGLVDPARVGFVGHSWGGYHGAYVATHSTLFAASVAGAPLTDFLSFMGQIHWNGGIPEPDHWETGQARMEVPYWEDKDAHRRNSPIERVQTMTTPLLLAHGNKDRVVEYFQSTVLYNFARRAGKPVILLTYEDEDHSFQQAANQVDYHRRLLEWFGHYLKGDPAPAWITSGIPFQRLEAEKRRLMDKRQP
jgi:dipeptidyl aminopeptidase/acylaminoacyl peptidase